MPAIRPCMSCLSTIRLCHTPQQQLHHANAHPPARLPEPNNQPGRQLKITIEHHHHYSHCARSSRLHPHRQGNKATGHHTCSARSAAGIFRPAGLDLPFARSPARSMDIDFVCTPVRPVHETFKIDRDDTIRERQIDTTRQNTDRRPPPPTTSAATLVIGIYIHIQQRYISSIISPARPPARRRRQQIQNSRPVRPLTTTHVQCLPTTTQARQPSQQQCNIDAAWLPHHTIHIWHVAMPHMHSQKIQTECTEDPSPEDRRYIQPTTNTSVGR